MLGGKFGKDLAVVFFYINHGDTDNSIMSNANARSWAD